MSETLTDEQVAALVEGCILRNGQHIPVSHVLIADAKALALEVQQTRQRRCENCHWWRSGFDEGNFAGGECRNEGNTVTASLSVWSCADFKQRRKW